MMKQSLFITTLIGGLAAVCAQAAEPASKSVVSAGEHDGYSRLVFDQADAEIAVSQSGRTVRLENFRAGAAFDLQNINTRRKAHRVLNARATAGGVELQLTCDCAVRTSRLSNGRFVVDIVDAGAKKAPSKTASNTAPASSSASAPASSKDLLSKEDLISVEEAHSQMVDLLKQAAREGLITIRDDTDGQGQGARAQKTAAAATTTEEPAVLTPPPAEDAPARETQNEQTAASGVVEPMTVAEEAKSLCRSDARFAVNAEGFDDEPLMRIAELQSALGENREDRDAMRALVEGFISIGFGEEAIALLVDHGEGLSLHADMARVIAERPVSANGALMGAQGCVGAHALWQAAASAPEKAATLYQQTDGAVNAMPLMLKRLMATRLSAKMIDAGAWEEAEELFAIASEGLENLSPELEYIRARLDKRHGENERARDTLLNLAERNSTAADDALLALADSYAEDGLTPHEGFTEDIGALARLQGSSRAVMAEAQSWAGLGNVEAALMMLQSLSQKTPEEREAAGGMAKNILHNALDSEDRILKISGLDGYVVHRGWLGDDAPAQSLRLNAAGAAIDFALPNLAYALLDEAPPPVSKEVSLEKAAAALAAGYADEAVIIAAPYAEDDAFAEIIVKANIAKGEHSTALAAASGLADPARKAGLTARAAWLARSWQSALRGYQGLDPNQLTGRTALNYALSAYMSGQRGMPAAAEVALSGQSEVVAAGLRALFVSPEPQSSALQRSRREVENTAREIRFFEEVLSDG